MNQGSEPFLNKAAIKRLLVLILAVVIGCFFFACCGDSIKYALDDQNPLPHFFHNIIDPDWWLEGIRNLLMS